MQYALLVRLHKPIGIFLLLWPALWALWASAGGPPPLRILWAFVIGAVLMRSAGCAINDYFDRDFDRQVARTRVRPLAVGRITPQEALLLAIFLAGIAFLLAWAALNRLALLLAVPALLLAALYPLSKRFMPAPQLVLGLAFGWSIPMAFAAVTGTVPPLAWLLFAATLLWTMSYDTIYAMADREDDLRIGIRSMAILCGPADRVFIAVSQVLCLALLIVCGLYAQYRAVFYECLLLATCLAAYQQYLIRDGEPRACLRSFHHANWFGALVFMGFLLSHL